MLSYSNDTNLIRAIKDGDKEAFSELFHTHYPRIFSFLNNLLKSKDLAEEITQDAFFRLWINHASLNTDMSIDAYLFSIAKNTAISLHKRLRAEQKYIDAQPQRLSSGTDDNLNFSELQQIIDKAIDKMPPQQQLVFRLSREQELRSIEIAQKLNISKRTVEKHITNSLKSIKKLIEKNYLLLFFC